MEKRTFLSTSCSCCYVVRTDLGMSRFYGQTAASAMRAYNAHVEQWRRSVTAAAADVAEKAHGEPRAVWRMCPGCR